MAAPWSMSNSGTTPCLVSAADKNGSVMNAASTRCAASAAPMAGNGTTTKCTESRVTPWLLQHVGGQQHRPALSAR